MCTIGWPDYLCDLRGCAVWFASCWPTRTLTTATATARYSRGASVSVRFGSTAYPGPHCMNRTAGLALAEISRMRIVRDRSGCATLLPPNWPSLSPFHRDAAVAVLQRLDLRLEQPYVELQAVSEHDSLPSGSPDGAPVSA